MAAKVLPITLSLILVGLATILLMLLRDVLGIINLVTVVYLLPVVIAALNWGIVSALAAALAAAAAADFFFYPPLYTFVVEDPQNLADLAVFLIVAVVLGDRADRLRREAETLRRSRKEISDVLAFSHELTNCFTVAELVSATQTYLSQTLGLRAFLISSRDIDRELAGESNVPQSVHAQATAMIAADDHTAHTIVDPQTLQTWLIHLMPAIAGYAAIANLGSGSKPAIDATSRRVQAILAETTTTLARIGIADAVEEARLRSQADRLREAVVGSMSHDLRSPLTSILGSTSVLKRMTVVQTHEDANELVEAIDDQASRLDCKLEALLNAARLSGRGGESRALLTDPADIVTGAIKLKTVQLAAHKLEIELVPDLPLVKVNSALIEQALGQLLENAAKYSPPGSSIKVCGGIDRQWIVLSVTDHGAGFTADEKSHVGEQSFRGARYRDKVPGAGLGLWIASAFVRANGGELVAESPGPALGSTVSLRLPAAPSTGDEEDEQDEEGARAEQSVTRTERIPGQPR